MLGTNVQGRLMNSDDNFQVELNESGDARLRDAVLRPLVAYNASLAGEPEMCPLNVLLKDRDERVQGGLCGRTGYGWLTIELLFLPARLRGKGVGRSIVVQAEHEAQNRGCHHAWLDTHEFQARGFYEKLGYACFGELPDFPAGHRRFFMSKSLPDRSP